MQRRSAIGFAIALVLLLGAPPSRAQQPSLEQIKIAAEAGDAAAQDKLAERFILRGDSAQAVIWYRKAAEQGLPHAQGRLGYILLNHYKMGVLAPDAKTAAGTEALKWARLAAIQGDKRGQADLADITLAGKIIPVDLIEAYKWGALAAQGSSFDPITITGGSIRDAAILKMTPEQTAEGRKRVESFMPHKPQPNEIPADKSQFKLNGISGPPEHRLAIINGQTLAQGEDATVKISGQSIHIHCVEIKQRSVIITAAGTVGTQELFLPAR